MEIPKDKRFLDLTGKKFGKIYVAGYNGKKNNRHYWSCLCECGIEKIIEGGCLKSGNTQSCGCFHRSKVSSQKIDLVGKKFGRLTVLEYAGCTRPDRSKKKNHQWKCLCDCGREAMVLGDGLRYGSTKSCGCLQKERARKSRLTHGMSGKPGYMMFRFRENPACYLRNIVSLCVRRSLKKQHSSKNGGRTFDHLPYTPQQLKEHLEKQFEPWMTWDNFGGRANEKKKTWWIDHIKPQTRFPYTSLDDPLFQECWSLDNLRPLEKIENIKKGNRS